jgi:hypothetical protein
MVQGSSLENVSCDDLEMSGFLKKKKSYRAGFLSNHFMIDKSNEAFVDSGSIEMWGFDEILYYEQKDV